METEKEGESMWGRVALQSLTEIAVTHYYTHTHTFSHSLTHKCCGIQRTRGWVNGGEEGSPCLGQKEKQVKPGGGEQEGSRSGDVWILVCGTES